MKTTYAFKSLTLCPFSQREHRPKTDGEAGHLLVFDDEARVLSFVDAATKLGVAGNAFLTDDKDFRAARDWIAARVKDGSIAQVDPPTVASSEPARQPEPVNAAKVDISSGAKAK